MKLYNIRVLLNRANCWNFQIDKRNLDIAVSASSNSLFFFDLLIIIFVRGKADHHYWRSTFLKKALFSCIFASKPDIFLTKFRLRTVSRFSEVYCCNSSYICHTKAMTTLVEYGTRCLYENTNFYSVLIVRSASWLKLKSSHFRKCCEKNFYLCVRLMQNHMEIFSTIAKLL